MRAQGDDIEEDSENQNDDEEEEEEETNYFQDGEDDIGIEEFKNE